MQAKQLMLGLFGSALLGGGVAVGGYKLLEPVATAPQTAVASDPNVRYTSAMRSSGYAAPEGLNFVAAASAVTPAVVHVMTEYAAAPPDRQRRAQMDPFLRQFFGDGGEGQGQEQPQGGGQGSGSGVIIAPAVSSA